MKRSWLIGAALVFSLSAVACGDDEGDDGDDNSRVDAGDAGGGAIDAGPGIDAARPDSGADASGDAR